MRIYLDNNATTALDPKVFKVMLKEFSGPPANPSSTHWFGREAKLKLNLARESIASFFQAKPDEIIFTSGGTESLNMVLRSIPKGSHIITTSIEHSAVHNTIEDLEKKGYPITRIPVGLWGAPLIEKIEEAIQDNTKALVFTLSNAETGVKIDIEKIATLAHKKNIPLFLDAVSFIGKEKLIHHLGITAMALSAHKFHGPKGIGALFVRSSYKISPLILGGAQEKQRRAGTEIPKNSF